MDRDTHRETAEKIIVRVDRELEDLIPGFIENRNRDITAIRAAMDQADFDTVRSLGHGMRGAGGGYGFDAITDIGAAMESTANLKDATAIGRLTRQLSSYLDRIEIVFV